MVERLKQAIEKARADRSVALGAPEDAAPRPTTASAVAPSDWSAMAPLATTEPSRLINNRIVTAAGGEQHAAAFDLLRTQLLSACRTNGWRRIGVTSPTKNSGKTTVTTNLAYSISRTADRRVALIDLDLRRPMLAQLLGLTPTGSIRSALSGAGRLDSLALRMNERLVVVPGAASERGAAELLASETCAASLDAFQTALQPDILLIDLPPVLACDDVLAIAPRCDALMMVVASGGTRPADVEECFRLIGDSVPILGIVLNKEQVSLKDGYDYY